MEGQDYVKDKDEAPGRFEADPTEAQSNFLDLVRSDTAATESAKTAGDRATAVGAAVGASAATQGQATGRVGPSTRLDG